MGRSSNPMQEHHRQKRVKEIQKNKEQRIKARDERVAQTKTVAGVQEEIRNLKRRKNLQPSEQQKLQRLEKELKLVKAASASKPRTHSQQQQEQKPLTELDDPRKSVYYDEKMNPYGAPPPGKPKMYHQRGGGVTMDIKLAGVPGEEPPRHPPPPPPAPPSRPAARQTTQQKGSTRQPRTRLPETKRALPAEEPRREEQSTPVEDEKQSDQEDKPLVLPELPEASKAVKRSRRGNGSVDIWASTDEIDYERRANKVDLEADEVGAAAPKKKKKKVPLEFFYRDLSQQVQGPFTKQQMKEWFHAGFFPPSVLVKTTRSDQWVPIADVPALQQQEPVAQEAKSGGSGSSLQDRIAALKNTDTTPERAVQERIKALKASQTPHSGQDAHLSEVPPAYPVPNIDTADPAPPKYPTEQDNAIPPPYPVDDPPDTNGDTSAPTGPYQSGDPPAPYPLDLDTPAPYTVDDESNNNSHSLEAAQQDLVPSPPVEGAPHYPTELAENDIPYPVDAGYPVTDAYPVTDEYPVVDSYPVTDAYPSTSEGDFQGSNLDGQVQYPVAPEDDTKKTIKVDKAVVAFLPSHLQKRKREVEETSVATKQVHQRKQPPKDDYDKFMDEIDGLDGG